MASGPKATLLVLSQEERAGLERIARRRKAGQALAMRARMVLACFACIEGFYNPLRLHSGPGYRSPTDYERGFHHDQASPMASLPEQVH